MKKIEQAILDHAFDYNAYRELIDNLFAEGKTTGPIQNEAMLQYTKLNIARMKRLDKTTKLKENTLQKLKEVNRPIVWLTITEAWCGDAAQVIPVMEKMAGENNNLSLKYIFRDENLDIMDAFLTNGGRSIPKIIILDASDRKVLGSWGPRPTEAQTMVMDARDKAETIHDKEGLKEFWAEVKKNTQLWYAKDKTISVQMELLDATVKALEDN